jgi:hypothetical protein
VSGTSHFVATECGDYVGRFGKWRVVCSCGYITSWDSWATSHQASTQHRTQHQQPKCRYGEHEEYGPCGGPSNGRECWQHAMVTK